LSVHENLGTPWSGPLKKEENYVNGKLEGLVREWHENGQLGEERNYMNGKLEGLWRTWLSNGKLYLEYNYINGKQVP
jgi:antitoxin component YwqK of YwqJK toxin-antitoxin module